MAEKPKRTKMTVSTETVPMQAKSAPKRTSTSKKAPSPPKKKTTKFTSSEKKPSHTQKKFADDPLKSIGNKTYTENNDNVRNWISFVLLPVI